MSQAKLSCRTTSKNINFRVSLALESIPPPLSHFPWPTISDLKQRISKALKAPSQMISKSETQPLMKKRPEAVSQMEKTPLKIELKFPTNTNILPSLSGLSAVLSPEGTAGTYILKAPDGLAQLVFKPQDEEPFAPMNPRGYVGKLGSEGFRPGVKSGEAVYREVAAYTLDHLHFSSVPWTALAESSSFSYKNAKGLHTKLGSVQQFVSNIGCAENFAPSKFATDEVHKIGVLDIRLLNMDRNTSNLLVGKDMNLIPIDHGLSLPDSILIESIDVCWMDWKQSKEPFSPSTLEFIRQVDLEEDLRTVRSLVKNNQCLKNMRVAGILLKKGAAAGLKLFEIGSLLYRKKDDEPSTIELIIKKAEKTYFSARKFKVNRLKIKAQDNENNLSNITQDTSTDSVFRVEELFLAEEPELFSHDYSNTAFDDGLFEVIEQEIDLAIANCLNRETKTLRSCSTNVDTK